MFQFGLRNINLFKIACMFISSQINDCESRYLKNYNLFMGEGLGWDQGKVGSG